MVTLYARKDNVGYHISSLVFMYSTCMYSRDELQIFLLQPIFIIAHNNNHDNVTTGSL